ncbi:MAG: hypothetical protein ACTMIH_01850 [Microbacterium gubbeenense]|uniref:hypothetical protein n=1 Tax=Microbacterium gubbeenense TaxID=159896 RepID=UPI003F9A63B1
MIFAELRAGWASWTGVIFVSAITALACGIAISMLETGMHAGEDYLQGFSGGTAAILMFSAPAGIAVIAAVTRLAVDLGRPAYARWQLAGVGPFQTALVVITQVGVASLFGGVIGVGATTLIAGTAIHSAFESGTGGYSEIPIVTGPLTAFITIPATVVISVLGSLRSACAAGRTPPLAALREPETEAKRMRWWRWMLLLAVIAGAIVFFVSLFRTTDRMAFLSQGPLVPVVITVVLAAAGTVVYPWLLRGWTALVPARVSTSWYLARHQARYHLSRSTASITPLFTGTALLGGLFTMAATVDASLRAGGEEGVTLEISQVLLMLGGPVLLAAVGAAVVIFMSNRTQSSEQALLRASGATTSTVIFSALWQAVIHVVTAAILGGVAIILTAVLTGAALGRFSPAVIVVDAAYALALVGVGVILTMFATVSPVATRARGSVAMQLAAK